MDWFCSRRQVYSYYTDIQQAPCIKASLNSTLALLVLLQHSVTANAAHGDRVWDRSTGETSIDFAVDRTATPVAVIANLTSI